MTVPITLFPHAKLITGISSALLMLTLNGCEHKPNREQQLTAAISEFSGQAESDYQPAFVDLNNDGVDDALVLLTGSDWCGSGGCTLLVLTGQIEPLQAGLVTYKVVSKSTVTRSPIRVSESVTGGWRDLIVHSGGADKWLPFNGQRYPANPSVQSNATATQLESANIVLP